MKVRNQPKLRRVYDEGTESAEVATSVSYTRRLQNVVYMNKN